MSYNDIRVSPEQAINEILEYNIESTVSSYDFAYKLSATAKKLDKTAKIHIALDTGMGRIGFRESSTSIEKIKSISKLKNLVIVSTFSHFATADKKDKEYSKLQLHKYTSFQNSLLKWNLSLSKKSIANSAAIIDLYDTHYDFVRPGIILYGYYPSDEVNLPSLPLKPVLTWKCKITHIKTLEKNQYIGYGKTFKTNRKSVIATLPVGYGDGYSRRLSNKAKVIINGQLAPVIGNICMDQCMIDITDIDGVNLNDEVIILGIEDSIKFNSDDMANILGTINYEPLYLIGRRVPRVYVKDGQVINIVNYM